MITSEVLEGVPILVLANKQDVEVRSGVCFFFQIRLETNKSLAYCCSFKKVGCTFKLNLFSYSCWFLFSSGSPFLLLKIIAAEAQTNLQQIFPSLQWLLCATTELCGFVIVT